ncbi:hypothetical protein [Oceanirhabdus sp. W0125-5]|uniref:hypothetical protein n=1 Tax=Oceanirhabdus sp. W0125-5 TaxID=2999116 RepID=UPI0022F34111|nr:hypothetical protein [Oceanirhabdus sp. W0125-5]WBW96007.1 hypothetical protein OW730_20275 [Oceanirhabdus sp. W0125-5]
MNSKTFYGNTIKFLKEILNYFVERLGVENKLTLFVSQVLDRFITVYQRSYC